MPSLSIYLLVIDTAWARRYLTTSEQCREAMSKRANARHVSVVALGEADPPRCATVDPVLDGTAVGVFPHPVTRVRAVGHSLMAY